MGSNDDYIKKKLELYNYSSCPIFSLLSITRTLGQLQNLKTLPFKYLAGYLKINHLVHLF